jgi:hypothetical protein
MPGFNLRQAQVRLAKKAGVDLRQSYARFGNHALIAHQRYAHAKQFNRANRALKAIRTMLGRVIRDIGRCIRGEADLEAAFPCRSRSPTRSRPRTGASAAGRSTRLSFARFSLR